ncbi:hypothetical protein SO802_021805 [Lithocarpus litseifolius]|uniref:Uncharacterized protein n=1 Tax=Lithocarpus litseifolius TaxID=425828 RepID=A0AAW2CFU6_9ROSI
MGELNRVWSSSNPTIRTKESNEKDYKSKTSSPPNAISSSHVSSFSFNLYQLDPHTTLSFSFRISKNKNIAVPNFNLVNHQSLDKILQAEVFVHKDGQLRAAHLILEYTPLLSSFQAPKCQIKARDPRLHQISIAVPSFLVIDPILEGVPKVDLPFLRTAKEAATPSQPAIKEEEEVVDISESKDDFEVFNYLQSLEVPTEDPSHPLSAQASQIQEDFSILEEMVIQRKPRASLMEVMKSQIRSKVFEAAAQAKLSLIPTPQDPQEELTDKKRKREQKGKDVVEEH